MLHFRWSCSNARGRDGVLRSVATVVVTAVAWAGSSVWAAPPTGAEVVAPRDPGRRANQAIAKPSPIIPANGRPVVASGDVGACCYGTYGACVEGSESSCQAGGGRFKGTGTECTELSCSGACCFGDDCNDGYGEGGCTLDGGTYQGDGALCSQLSIACPPRTGACCLTDGCAEVSALECAETGRSFFGLGTYCWQVASCEPPVLFGACCFPEGNCSLATAARCAEAGGSPLPAGTRCFSGTCSGACCFSVGCGSRYAPFWCGFNGGSFQGFGSRCTDEGIPCPNGACCFPWGDCSQEVTRESCTSQGGEFLGVGVSCKDVACRGACCTRYGECTQTAPADCDGTFLGRGMDCGGESCPQTGACCFADFCEVVTEAACKTGGGDFRGTGALCEGGSCEGACCDDHDGTCALTISGDCNGAFRGPGTTCDVAECPPVGACCFDWGCEVATQDWCTNNSGQFAGPGSECGACLPAGACCFDAGCEERTEPSCIDRGGNFLGADRHCSGPLACNFDGVCTGSCPGACCAFTSSACTDRFSLEECEQFLEGEFMGHGTRCTDSQIACVSELGACCVPPPAGGPPSPNSAARTGMADVHASLRSQGRRLAVSGRDWSQRQNLRVAGKSSESCLDRVTAFECALLLGQFHLQKTCTGVECPRGLCPGLEDCCTSHRSLGCRDENCCRTVCGADPWCCLPELSFFAWDDICVSLANRLCGDGAGGYCASHLADLNGDGVVNLQDYAFFQNSFGQ